MQNQQKCAIEQRTLSGLLSEGVKFIIAVVVEDVDLGVGTLN